MNNMMQTLTKTELAWIYSALEKEVKQNVNIMNQFEVGSLEYQLAEHKRDAFRGTMHKIHSVLNDGSKRICIK